MSIVPHPVFDSIEFVRGLVASLSNTSNINSSNSVSEINIIRLQEYFSRSELSPELLKPTLESLRLLGEVEHLGNGYWIPTPTRLVHLNDDISLVVSIANTAELERHFPQILRAGLGRIGKTKDLGNLPVQTLESWCGVKYTDITVWTKSQIQSHSVNFSPSILSSNIEFFDVKEEKAKRHREPIWHSKKDHIVSKWKNVSLMRSKIGQNKYRYFLGTITSNGQLLEGPVVSDPLTFQYGFASLLGKPLTVMVQSRNNAHDFRLALAVPRSVRCILYALCESEPKSLGYAWKCIRGECWQIVNKTLQMLGCEVINYE